MTCLCISSNHFLLLLLLLLLLSFFLFLQNSLFKCLTERQIDRPERGLNFWILKRSYKMSREAYLLLKSRTSSKRSSETEAETRSSWDLPLITFLPFIHSIHSFIHSSRSPKNQSAPLIHRLGLLLLFSFGDLISLDPNLFVSFPFPFSF